MKNSLFITGASGYIGGNLLLKINPGDYHQIYCLYRSKSKIIQKLAKRDGFTFIKGSLFDNRLYESSLSKCTIAIHIAGATGNMKKEEYFTVNGKGTEFFTGQCEKGKVKNLLYISTIAVTFKDISCYFYAQSKKQGEEAVKKCTLNYTIIRPTNVIGTGSSLFKSMAKLATLPIMPIFGNGTPKIQPIYIDDLTECMISILNEKQFSNETYDIGGPDIISIEAFLSSIHNTYFGKTPFIVHIPMAPLVFVLSILEKMFYSLLPINRGQLTSFMYDSTIQENNIYLTHRKNMKNAASMIALSIPKESKKETSTYNLEKECNHFCRYLMGQPQNKYISEKYIEAHRTGSVNKDSSLGQFDNFLVAISLHHPIFTRLSDAYTRIFYKKGVLRKKLMLLVALLECSSPSYTGFDSENDLGLPAAFLKLAQDGFFFGLILITSIVLLLPVHLAFAIMDTTHSDP